MMAVSPFDGANRIRFKGSPSIADFRLRIADLPARHSSNPQSEISNPQSADSQPFGSPENSLLVNVFNCRPTRSPMQTGVSADCADYTGLRLTSASLEL